MLSYVCFPFLHRVKFCSDCFRQVFFITETKRWLLVALGRWWSYTITIVWEFAWVDSALVVLEEWLSYRGGQSDSLHFVYRQTNKSKDQALKQYYLGRENYLSDYYHPHHFSRIGHDTEQHFFAGKLTEM